MESSADPRPSWDSFFLALAFLVAQRSPDAETKHGAVVVDRTHRVLGLGFNGFPRGARDEKLPRNRPSKYPYIIHAELNALINARTINEPAQCTIYVTGEPCNECFKAIIQYGIGRIVHGAVGSNCITSDQKHDMVRSAIADGLDVKVERFDGPIEPIVSVLDAATEYLRQRS